MKETILPYLCTNETAEFLDIPDGTPIFYHTVSMNDSKQSCICWDMISTANIFLREMELDMTNANEKKRKKS